MSNLLWFHAFDRDDPVTAVLAVQNGITVPRSSTSTKQLELDLGMADQHVYCYLGRTRDAFGTYAIAFREVLEGQVSPFDSGGLVNHCTPVCDWSETRRREYLEAYSWSQPELRSLLAQYPGESDTDVSSYLDTREPPVVGGPHLIWSGKPVAEIWNVENHWCSWTWEARIPNTLNAQEIVAWTCPPACYESIMTWYLDVADDESASWFEEMILHYIEGGVGPLLEQLTQSQVGR